MIRVVGGRRLAVRAIAAISRIHEVVMTMEMMVPVMPVVSVKRMMQVIAVPGKVIPGLCACGKPAGQEQGKNYFKYGFHLQCICKYDSGLGAQV